MFYSLTLRSVTAETASSVALTFNIPTELSETFNFQAGQYLTLRATIEGKDIRRSYSIAAFGEGTLTVGVKQVPEGLFSTFAQGLTAGDILEVMPPEGRFVCNNSGDVVLVAAGSGITPLVAIATEVLARGDNVTLVYGNQRTESIMFRSALDSLKDRYLGKFTLIHILSREEQDVELMNGRITGEKINALVTAHLIEPAKAEGIFICGPGEMTEGVAKTLKTVGFPKSKIYLERFFLDGETQKSQRPLRSKTAAKVAQGGVAVSVILDGSHRDFTLAKSDDNIIDAAARQGIELPFSCKGGMCCTCRCKVSEGSAELPVNYSLEQWELDAGFTLACQTQPTSAKVTLDFDAV